MEQMELATAGFSLDQLTQSQTEAVYHKDGPLLIIAGPGSGKTRVITCRISQLINSGVKPYNICAITFTNKAAQEMKERVFEMGVPAGIHVSTFHSLCVRILREFSDAAGMNPNFSIYSDADQKKCIKDAIADVDASTTNFQPSKVLNAISKFKNDLEDVESVKRRADGFYLEIIGKIYERYQQILTKNNAVDFDDLLMKTAFLLRNRPDIRERLGDRFRYLLVDEYQDTNHAQYQIAKGLALSHGNICVTGDPDQSIYRWRGADISNILAFEKDWPQAKVVKLEENFRSSPDILRMADKLISKNSQRKDKRLIPTLTRNKAIEMNAYPDEQLEAQAVAGQVKKLMDKGVDLNEIAVLYRVNSMSRTIEEAFIDQQVPYLIVRGVEFYSRKEIRDMIAYLKVIANPDDDIALERIINTPARGIGKTTIGRIQAYGRMKNKSMFEAALEANLIDTLSKAAQSKVAKFANMIQSFRFSNAEQPASVSDLLEMVFVDSGISASLTSDDKEDTARENVEELINSAGRYEEQTDEPNLLDYLQTIALYSDTDAYDPESGAVSLMSLHAAKGLEFEHAFIIGLEEGLLPHERSKENPEELEEERRLFFVGITRAKYGLYISYAKYRSMRGMLNRTIPSKFLFEVGMKPENSFGGAGFDSFDGRVNSSRFGGGNANRFGSAKRSSFNKMASKPAAPKSSAPKKPDAPFSVGELVKHKKFGLGRVKEFHDLGEKSVVTVKFNSGQTKALMLKYANLEKVNG